MAIAKDSKNQIIAEINRILVEQDRPSTIATRAEEAQSIKNKELVDRAANYTVDTIVKGMADLQLEFGSAVAGLAERLTLEAEKLTTAKQAIEIETQYRAELQKIRVVADALHIITQEHQQSLNAIDRQLTTEQEELVKEQTQVRKNWELSAQEYAEQQAEIATNTTKERQKEQDDFQYKLVRDRQLEADKYAEKKRIQELEIQSRDRELQKQWQEREKLLTDNQKLLEENLAKVAAFPTELEEAVKKAREEAIRETTSDAKVKAELFEKEWEGNKQNYEMKIQSLERVIDRQSAQIEDITAQLQVVVSQAQSLAMRAFETTAKAGEKN